MLAAPMAYSQEAKDLPSLNPKGYLIVVRVSPQKDKYMAVAVPEDPGKSGRYYYVINQEGKMFRSTKEIPLNDACAIPDGLQPVGR